MKKILFIICFALLVLVALALYQYHKFHDGKLHIVFCDVGQGDGIFITTPSGKQILVDAGPDRKILDCLSSHMPFWDRKIELAILTHPHADHFVGYYYVIDRYIIDQFATEELKNKSDGFTQLQNILQAYNLKVKHVYEGDRWVLRQAQDKDNVVISIEAPNKEFLFGKNPDGFITNSAESASLITSITYGDFSALLTGDAPLELIREVGSLSKLSILQIPHHGSNTGIDEQVLDLLAPKLAVISVGKNSYGHPTKRVLDLLSERSIKTLRTDQIGHVEIVSDGASHYLY